MEKSELLTSECLKQRFLWICVVLWMTIIFCFSAQDATESSNLSGVVLTMVVNIIRMFVKITDSQAAILAENLSFWIRKTAHFTVYIVLGLLVFEALYTSKRKGSVTVCSASIICFLYAASDEWHQSFVPGRCCEFRDVCIDFCGAVTGILLLMIIYRTKKNTR